MLHYLIKIVDNSFAAVVVAAILLLIIVKVFRNKHKLIIGWGLALGFVAALVYAVIKRNTGFGVREFYDLGVIFVCLAALLVVWLNIWRAGKFVSDNDLNKPKFAVLGWALMAAMAGLAAYTLPNIMLYPFEFAVGMDSIFNQDYLLKVVGYAAGLLIMLLAGVGIYKITARIPSFMLTLVIAACVLVFMLAQALEISQILLTRGLIPRYGWLMSLVIGMLEHANWFIYALSAIMAFVAITLTMQIRLQRAPAGNPAQVRKLKAVQRTQKRYCWLTVFMLLIIILTITVGRYYENRGVELSPPIELPVTNGQIIIPLPSINDGHLHRYVYKADNGTEIRYIVIRKSESGYGVGLDACDICGPSGYYERNDKEVICILCDVVMNISTIGFPGGCNPVPLKFSISDGNLVILSKDLEAERRRFE